MVDRGSLMHCRRGLTALFALTAYSAGAQVPSANTVRPNLATNIDRPLRYRPEGQDFVIENGTELFNRPLYGGNTAFRVDGGDRPELVMYLPGRGGNLRLGIAAHGASRWLHESSHVITRYRPGSLLYEVRDPLLGSSGILRVVVVAYHQTEGLVLRVEADSIAPGVELIWAYGGVNGQRGVRDGDIGTEKVPISEWFQLKPEFAKDNVIEVANDGFTLRSSTATIVGVTSAPTRLFVGSANDWNDLNRLLGSATLEPERPILAARAGLTAREPVYISLQRVAAPAAEAKELDTYREVTREAPGTARPVSTWTLAAQYDKSDLPRLFDASVAHFAALRSRVAMDTPDPYLNAAIGALNVAADAVWDEPQKDIMHGAVAWRTRLLGWRGPYLLDALGWHDRATTHYTYWAGRQNLDPVALVLLPADSNANLARSETGLHSNGDMSNSHYDMNLVYIDALFRHLQWTGDLALARQLWPAIERHLAWERRLFRRELGPEKLPLYEAYAAIWASDDLGYNGGGTTHASAYNYYHNVQAARLARLLNVNAAPYEREAALIAKAMRSELWLPGGGFGEYKDLLGLQRVHETAALWSFYHTMDSELPSAREAWLMSAKVDAEIPHLPVRGAGVPAGLFTLASSNWMPYTWSINNVVMGEAVHTALGLWRAGRPEEAWTITKGSMLAAMYMGISPGNVGSMSYLDVYRRESQRDFADGSGVLSRALVEGLYGVRPNALTGALRVEPGFPRTWDHASMIHPDLSIHFTRSGAADRYVIEQRFSVPQSLSMRLVAFRDRVASVTVNGVSAKWRVVGDAVDLPRIEINVPAQPRYEILIEWSGNETRTTGVGRGSGFRRMSQGQMHWWAPPRNLALNADGGTVRSSIHHQVSDTFEPVDLSAVFNARVTQIFKNQYRTPRSPFVSLATPKQGIGAWAGHMNETADIDDSGLRGLSARNHGRVILASGVPLATPGDSGVNNVVFTSNWDNYPKTATVKLGGRAHGVVLLMAGSTNHMQSRFENGEVVVKYADGTIARLALVNPVNWWPIEKDYFVDDYQFKRPEPLPVRVDLATGQIRVLDMASFKGTGGPIPGGSGTVLELPLDSRKRLASLTVRALANEVVIGLMAATLVR